ncbi:MAG: hypothetical protein EG825_09480 [Rhodocyclaceae bacterium]|nr:hypothetical protein [Rhodocyclaceae bacterium]
MKVRTVCLTPWHVAPGVTLAKAALQRNGNVLLTAGTLLTEAHLNQLRERGIDLICVELPDHRSAEAVAQDMADAEARVNHLFRGPGSLAREELGEAIMAYRRIGVA